MVIFPHSHIYCIYHKIIENSLTRRLFFLYTDKTSCLVHYVTHILVENLKFAYNLKPRYIVLKLLLSFLFSKPITEHQIYKRTNTGQLCRWHSAVRSVL